MNPIAICIAFIVSIVSVGTPLVSQVISTYDEKYHSENIIKLFENKINNWTFYGPLILTYIVVAIYIVISIIAVKTTDPNIDFVLTLVSYFLILVSAILVGLFIRFTLITIKFSRPTSLLNLIIDKNKAKKFKNIEILKSIIDLSINAIQKKDYPTFKKITNHFIDVFNEFGKDTSSQFYPEELFEIGYKITKELATNKNRDFDLFKQLTIDNLWMVDRINTNTYGRLWWNLRTVIENGEDEMVYLYWKHAFNHIQFNLRVPDSIYASPISTKKLNQSEIDIIETNRKEFIEFHYYLGGLLLYENRIECIRRIWDYTTSEPPNYPLLPSTLGEILKRYFDLCQIYDQKSWEKAAMFNFPRIDSVNFDFIVSSWVRKYLILIFFRQYTLQKYYIYQEFLSLPNTPESQAEKKHWIDNIESLKEILEEFLGDNKLLTELGLTFITKEWCVEQRKTYPLDLLDELKAQLEKEIKDGKNQMAISPKKEEDFWQSSKNILDLTLKKYDYLIKEADIKDSHLPFKIPGQELIFEKSVFADEQRYTVDFDSFLAERLSDIFRIRISESFSSVVTRKFLFNHEDVFSAIDRMEISKKASEFIIFSFKNNLEYYISVLKIKDLSKDSFKGVEIKDEWICNEDMAGRTFFILKKSDLPILIYNEPITKTKENYKPEENILPEYKIKASLIDLQREQHIREILETKYRCKDLSDNVLATIEMNAEIWWKKDAKVIAIRAASAYEDRGLPNKLEEVKPFDKIGIE